MTTSGLRAVRFAILFCSFSSPAAAQVISIKTVPIAQGDQFQIFPSNNLGMGGVSIALPDSLQDPFVNPAKGARLGGRGGRFFSAPTVYSVSRRTGGGRSLPLAALARTGSWYGGLALALQQVDPSRPPFDGGFIAVDQPIALLPPSPPNLPIPAPDDKAHGNEYVFAMAGKALPAGRLSVGASVLWAGLHAVDGVDLLYAGSRRVAQSGHSLDVRLGLLKEWAGTEGADGKEGAGRSLEALLLHNRFAARHDVTFVELFWDPITQQTGQRARLEENFDYTNTWGLHLEYEVPLSADGWRIGWLATANRMSHPKIPTYELAAVPAIPRDPGRSAAFNLGMGVSKVRGPATFAVEAIFEPIRSYTWADAATPVVTVVGDTIAAGGKTVENRFRFRNALFRMGASQEWDLRGVGKTAGVQFGLIVRSVRYRLAQTDNVQLLSRSFETGWLEWTPTWGLSLRFPELEIRYRGRVTHGAGRPGVQFPVSWARGFALAGNSILAAPTGPLVLTDVNTTTHQISLSLPLR
ncbi:MAG TPA: hypothetical protein VGQ06_07315 [Gemmatimonadales bacterium]|jgi:hypothetical protein|nr:hypothetical protein [Gemmatimonadales bacterium]